MCSCSPGLACLALRAEQALHRLVQALAAICSWHTALRHRCAPAATLWLQDCHTESTCRCLSGPCGTLRRPRARRYNPIKTIKTSFIGTMNMLGLAKRTKARFLLSSTSEVYGDPLEHPQTEGYWGNVNPIGERSCYDEGKRAAECLVFDYHREHNLDVRPA